jgi:hypothetical protein
MSSGSSYLAPLSTLGGAYGSSFQSPPEWVLELTMRMYHLEHHVALSDPSMVSSATTRSSHLPISATQSSWILDSGASFDVTHDSPTSIKIADDTPLPVVSHDTLHTPQFHVSISHVPQLHLKLFSVDQITSHDCRAIFDSNACSIQDCHMGTLASSSHRLHDPPRGA